MTSACKAVTVHDKVRHLTVLGYSIVAVEWVEVKGGICFVAWALVMDGQEVAIHRGNGFEAIDRFHDVVEGVAW